ncbi:hypothetical protein D9757_002651 [Collybiopsis confluens]|uniref:Cytochrome b5 heme-binding domain-containing protein n=1 Tax=Collybiopsis confluens TaxID=2823264 RepID=A0A8H5ME35_9AGAR|nr:hypothetical protein D9757_002651 [Collybiopsis confluens]
MSWFKSSMSGEEPEPYREPEGTHKVADPSIPNRMVTDKAANKPFLAHKAYRDKQEKLHNDWVERQRIRKEKIARGEEVGPEEKDPTEPEEVGFKGLLKFFLYLIIFGALTGKLFTGSFTWNHEDKLVLLKSFMPSDQRLFSESKLAQYDGSVPGVPILLAIDGDVYDVSKGKAYQPKGSYHYFAGVDASRAFATGCFGTHRTHDLRGITEDEMKSLEHWKDFYSNHKDYKKIGRVSYRPIDPASPIPEHCKPEKAAQQKASQPAEKNKAEQGKANQAVHEDL